MKKKREINFEWDEKEIVKTERIGAMYCFKRCDVNYI